MPSDPVFRCDTFYRCSEIYTIPHVSTAFHGFISSLIAAGSCLSFCKCQCQTSAGYRRKLSGLIYNACYSIRKDRTQHSVHHNRPYCHLPIVRFSASFTVDQICQQISVALRKAYFRDIPPTRLMRLPARFQKQRQRRLLMSRRSKSRRRILQL